MPAVRTAVSLADIVVTTGSGSTVRTRSNGTGGFALGGIPAGQHCRIDASAKGYRSASTEFDMPASGGIWVSVTLATGTGGIIVVPIPY